MPNKNTFEIAPISEFVSRYLRGESIDPFARNCRIATITNDIDPCTLADHHLHSLEFLQMLEAEGTNADVVLFDPPYTLRQAKEVYEASGRQFTKDDSQQAGRWAREKEIVGRIVPPGGHVLSFGYNSHGMGKKNGFEIVEILLVAHGGAHYDTICTAEIKL
jgi:hypothetical protein